MYDFDSHARFLTSAMDAWFNYTTAAFAAYGSWQNHISNQLDVTEPKSVPPASPYEQAFSWWTSMFVPAPPPKPVVPDFGAGFFQFSPMFSSPARHNGFDPAAMFNPFAMFGMAQHGMTNAWTSGWMEMMSAYQKAMPQFSASMFHAPMTAWLMAVGMPYAVAAPTARGNAASMDAAVAARESFDKMYSSFRTDGGHAVAPLLSQPMAMMLAPYWAVTSKYLH